MALFGADKSEQGKCEVDLDGSRHQCRLDGITRTGAKVNCTGFLRATSRGEPCVVHLQGDARQIGCRVTEIAAGRMHLRFVAEGTGQR